jgi:hypothetical protein
MRRSNFLCVLFSLAISLCFSNVAIALSDSLSNTYSLAVMTLDLNPHAGAQRVAVDSSDESAQLALTVNNVSLDIMVQTARWGAGLDSGKHVLMSRGCGCRRVNSETVVYLSTGPPERSYS